jgi:hypothetical protein
MKKKKKNVNQMCIDIGMTELTIPALEGEEWRKLDSPLYPNIREGYYISNKNRVYDSVHLKFMAICHRNPEIVESPYFRVHLVTTDESKNKDFLMHRLMMSIFNPVENMENLTINHIDGNKLNNELSNLEWCTIRENTIHALNTGLFVPVYGEKHCCATITEETAKAIISDLLQQNLPYEAIAKKYNTSKSIVNDIAIKKSWKHLTKGIPTEKLRSIIRYKKLTIDDIYGICTYFQNNPKDENMSIRKHCENALKYIDYKDIGEGMLNSVRQIYEHKRFTEISCNFIF